MAFEKDPNEIGSFWLKEGRKGEYLTGKIDGIGDVICFPVNSTNPKAPTWRVLKSTPREERPSRRYEGRESVPAPTDDDFRY